MNVGKTLFAQVMEFVPWKTFGRIIERHRGDSGDPLLHFWHVIGTSFIGCSWLLFLVVVDALRFTE
jgi:hypothetical protein